MSSTPLGKKKTKPVSVSIITTALGAARKFQQETPVWKCFVLIRACLFPSKDALWHRGWAWRLCLAEAPGGHRPPPDGRRRGQRAAGRVKGHLARAQPASGGLRGPGSPPGPTSGEASSGNQDGPLEGAPDASEFGLRLLKAR